MFHLISLWVSALCRAQCNFTFLSVSPHPVTHAVVPTYCTCFVYPSGLSVSSHPVTPLPVLSSVHSVCLVVLLRHVCPLATVLVPSSPALLCGARTRPVRDGPPRPEAPESAGSETRTGLSGRSQAGLAQAMGGGAAAGGGGGGGAVPERSSVYGSFSQSMMQVRTGVVVSREGHRGPSCAGQM